MQEWVTKNNTCKNTESKCETSPELLAAKRFYHWSNLRINFSGWTQWSQKGDKGELVIWWRWAGKIDFGTLAHGRKWTVHKQRSSKMGNKLLFGWASILTWCHWRVFDITAQFLPIPGWQAAEQITVDNY